MTALRLADEGMACRHGHEFLDAGGDSADSPGHAECCVI